MTVPTTTPVTVSAEEIKKMKVNELKDYLVSKNLAVTGKKEDLLKRALESLETSESAGSAAEQ